MGVLQRVLTSELEVPPAKVFKPKMNLPVLKEYRNARPSKEYWECWPKNYNEVGTTKINGEKLKAMALSLGYSDCETLDKVHKDLTEGA